MEQNKYFKSSYVDDISNLYLRDIVALCVVSIAEQTEALIGRI